MRTYGDSGNYITINKISFCEFTHNIHYISLAFVKFIYKMILIYFYIIRNWVWHKTIQMILLAYLAVFRNKVNELSS